MGNYLTEHTVVDTDRVWDTTPEGRVSKSVSETVATVVFTNMAVDALSSCLVAACSSKT